jgi:predicted Zn-dependent protease
MPDQAEALMGKAEANYRLKNYEPAIQALNIAIKNDPQNLPALQMRAQANYDSGKYHEALLDWDQISYLSGETTELNVNRGKAFFNLSEYKKAAESWSTAISNDPEQGSLYALRAKQ